MADRSLALTGGTRTALAGLRVLDTSLSLAGAFATHLLAAFGADVIAIEPPERHPALHAKLYPDDSPTPDDPSPVYRFLQANKRIAVLPPSAVADRIRELSRTADILVVDGPVSGLDFDVLRAANPALVMTVISGFGSDGPSRDWRITELVAFAMSGLMSALGEPDGTPVMGAGFPTLYHAGMTAATASLAAARLAERTGLGQLIDVSILETAVSTIEILLACTSYSGQVHHYLQRMGGVKMGMPSGVFPCADGHIVIGLANAQWPTTCDVIGRPDLAADPRFRTVEGRTEHQDEINLALFPWFLAHTKREVFEAAQQRGLGWGPVLNIAELIDDPQYQAREFLGPVAADGLRYPGPGVRTGGPAPVAPFRVVEAPEWREQRSGHSYSSIAGETAPLAGIRVLDLTVSWAGPRASMVLADLGAEVIKIEAPRYVDVVRGIASVVEQTSEYPDGERGERYWERNARFNQMSRNKLSLSLDLTKPAGQREFRSMVAISDVVLQGYRPSAADRLGIDYESLRAVNPAIILASLPLFGSSGPYRDFGGFGIVSDAMSGHGFLRAQDADHEPQLWFNPDFQTGILTPFAVIAALRRRETTGIGQLIDISQAEVSASLLGEYFLDYQRTVRLPAARGNRHPEWAPHGVYRCRPTPDQPDWIAIAVTNDAEWQALAVVLGDFPLARDPRLATAAGRRVATDLDLRIGALTSGWACLDLVDRLQAAAVAAGPVHTPGSVLADRQLRSRSFYRRVHHPAVGEHEYIGPAWRMSDTPASIRWIAPVFGEHSLSIFHDLLGLTDDFDRLREAGATGDQPNGA